MPELIGEKAASKILGITAGTLAVWRCHKKHALPFIKIGRSVRYDKEDLLAWIKRQRHTGAPPPSKRRKKVA